MSLAPLIWVRSESFDHGVFNTSVRWTVSKVQEFLACMWDAVSGLEIAREMWLKVATKHCKPPLTEVEASAYWHVFGVLQNSLFGKTGSAELLDVRIVGLLLMCQVFCPHRVRTDQFAMSGEMWPGLERAGGANSPRQSPRCSSPRGGSPRVGVSAQTSLTFRGRDAIGALLGFVREHLGHFLQVVCRSILKEPLTVTANEFDLLALILCAGPSATRKFLRLSEAIPDLTRTDAIAFSDLRSAVESILMWNEDVYSTGEHVQDEALANNLSFLKVTTVSSLTKSTWFQPHANTGIDVLNVMGCKECTIYLTGNVRFCLISGCHDCSIIVPAVSGACTIHSCEKISVHSAAHCFKMENSIDCSVYVYCHVPPILTGDTRGIKLAPFNVCYSQLERVLKDAKMSLERTYVDVWAHPVCCTLGASDETMGGGRSGGSFDDERTNSTYHFVHPDNFQPVVIPEIGDSIPESSKEGNALCLPQVYADALQTRTEDMRTFKMEFARAFSGVSDDPRKKRACQAIQGHFREWLQATGKSRYLADLARLSMTSDGR